MGGAEEKVVIEEEVVGPRPIPSPAIDLLLDTKPEIMGLVFWPDKRLGVPAEDVVVFDDELANLISSMAMTMYSTGGVGLAAPQVGVSKRAFVVDIYSGAAPQKGRPQSQLLIAVNPVIMPVRLPQSESMESGEEGCLSFPGLRGIVSRHGLIVLTAYDRHGKMYQLRCGGSLARIIQHEADHLDGVVFVDHMNKHERNIAVSKLKKFHQGVDRDKVRLVRKSG